MACSRTPGPQGQDGTWPGARTPGPMGYNDQSDPDTCSRLGDTPGALGVLDHADPALPTLRQGAATAQQMVRLADGTSLAMPAPPAAAAAGLSPWMTFAEEKARSVKGAKEAEIQKSLNFQTAVKTGQDSMVGTAHAWCAAFVNWCLMQAGFDVDNETFADHVYDKGRAHGFYEVTQHKLKKGEGPRPKVRNPLFVQLEGPVFGAIAMVANADGHGHHVGFVYARPATNAVVLLGGNQADTIKFSTYNIAAEAARTELDHGKKVRIAAKPDHLMFFVPAAYESLARADARVLANSTAEQLNLDFGIVAPKAAGRESTR